MTKKETTASDVLKTNFYKYLDRVENKGDSFAITRRGRLVAHLIPVQEIESERIGLVITEIKRLQQRNDNQGSK